MLSNWYHPSAPVWPPPGYTQLEFSSLESLEDWVRKAKREGLADVANPTNAERVLYFNETRCNMVHTVTGRMLVIGGLRYPFARCDGVDHREFLVPWSPYTWGTLNG